MARIKIEGTHSPQVRPGASVAIDGVSTEETGPTVFSGTRRVSRVTESSVEPRVSREVSVNRKNLALFDHRIKPAAIVTGQLIQLAPLSPDNSSQVNIVTGLDAVATHRLQGIPGDLLASLMNSVESRGAALFTRPVEPICKTLIDEGWPTKHFRIKAKSSNWGAQAGTIPVDQKYSKLALDTEGKVKKYNKLAEKSLVDTWPDGTKTAESIPLKISQSRLEELERKGYLYNRKDHVSKNGTPYVLFNSRVCNRDDARECTQLLTKAADGSWRVYDADKQPPSAIRVMAQPAENPGDQALPITADIDPLMESFPLEEQDLAHQDRLPLKLVSDQIVKRQVDKYRKRLQKRFNDKKISEQQLVAGLRHYENLETKLLDGFYTRQDASGKEAAREDPDMGNVTQRTRDMIQHYDKTLGRKHRVIHHNVDAHSLATDEKVNYPVTAFFPKSLNMMGGICMIFNEEQLLSVFTDLMERGYAIEKNPLWGKAWLNSMSYHDARASLAFNMQERMSQEAQFVAELEQMMLSDSPEADFRSALEAEIDQFLGIYHADRRDSAISMGSPDSLDSSLSSDEESIANLLDFDDSGIESDPDND